MDSDDLDESCDDSNDDELKSLSLDDESVREQDEDDHDDDDDDDDDNDDDDGAGGGVGSRQLEKCLLQSGVPNCNEDGEFGWMEMGGKSCVGSMGSSFNV